MEIPTKGTWLDGLWVFAIRNTLRPLVGGPAHKGMYLVGPMVEGYPARPGRARYVTVHFDEFINWRLVSRREPLADQIAVEIAKCYAWLTTQSHPDRLKILGEGEVPTDLARDLERSDPALLKSIREQIVALRVTAHRVVASGAQGFTVEFCAFCPDFWGDIYFWHVEIGPHWFSASRRPILLGSRALE